MNYCSHCGSRALVRKIPKGDNTNRFVCETCGTIHYQNPKIVVGCLPIYKDQILLCKRSIEPCKGKWNLPAGFMENGETAEEGAVRETYEEACVKVELIRLHCIYTLTKFNQVYLLFLSNLSSPEFKPGDETEEVRLFKPDEIPWDEIGFVSSIFALERHFEDPSSLTVHIGSYNGNFIGR